jgi:hypothetical protein
VSQIVGTKIGGRSGKKLANAIAKVGMTFTGDRRALDIMQTPTGKYQGK